MSLSIPFFNPTLGNDFDKSTKDHCLKIDTNIVHYKEKYGLPRAMGSARISGLGVTDPDRIHRRLHDIYLSPGSDSDHAVVNTAVIQKDSASIPYTYELHHTSLNEVTETLADVSSYGFYVFVSKAKNAIGNKSNDSFLKNIFEQNEKEAGG